MQLNLNSSHNCLETLALFSSWAIPFPHTSFTFLFFFLLLQTMTAAETCRISASLFVCYYPQSSGVDLHAISENVVRVYMS